MMKKMLVLAIVLLTIGCIGSSENEIVDENETKQFKEIEPYAIDCKHRGRLL